MNVNTNNNLRNLVNLITQDIRSRGEKSEKWAKFKNENNATLHRILGLPESASSRAGDLIGFDIHPSENLILLNYTSQAHNVLHEVEGGWTSVMRAMRGLVYSFGNSAEDIKLVSRGFDKFFNQSELPETTIPALMERCGEKKLACREKADGHMVECFLYQDRLFTTTRGKFGTLSAMQASEMMDRSHWIKADLLARSLKKELMTLVVELVTPESEVHVDYDGEETMYLLAAYDSSGNKIHNQFLSYLAEEMPDLFSLPGSTMMTLSEVIKDVQDRSIENKEGWVVDCCGMLVKFKYETYIGKMVASKLSYKYIMRCIQKDRLEKMICTLPEEIREIAEIMVGEIMDKVIDCQDHNSHLPLYELYSQLDGGESYFRTICREFWKEWASKLPDDYQQLEMNI